MQKLIFVLLVCSCTFKCTMIVRDTIGQEVVAENIKYLLYNSSNPDTYTPIDASNASVLSKTAPIVFFLHGWIDSSASPWYYNLKNAFFQRGSEYLIIEVDWSVYATLNYYLAQFNTKDVGFRIGDFIATLNTNYNIPLANILLIGHSLGSQVAAFAGKRVFEILNEQLPRIVGMDPAGPLFQGRPSAERLTATDAKVVHVIHSNAGVFGYLGDCGTIDFSPNGGTLQPGCRHNLAITVSAITSEVFCDHGRTLDYFVEAVQTPTPTFISTKCSSYLVYKIASSLCDGSEEQMCSLDTTKTGDYFLDTNSEPPYSK